MFNRAWTETAKAAKGFGKSGPNVQFADLRGKGKVDCLWIDDKKGSILAWYNDGIVPKFKWTKANNGKVIIPGYCLGTHVRLPNLTGSGQSDYVVSNHTQLSRLNPSYERSSLWRLRMISISALM